MTAMAPETPLPTRCDAVTSPAPPGVTPSQPTSAARVRRYRARKAAGDYRVTITVKGAQVAWFEANGYLEGGRDRQAIADAVRLFIFDHMPQ